ncbi:hypothetical protein OH492_17065 [Vibrio chagasii]|nr:hypothetical protein [Vibrio chagasii]
MNGAKRTALDCWEAIRSTSCDVIGFSRDLQPRILQQLNSELGYLPTLPWSIAHNTLKMIIYTPPRRVLLPVT